MHRCIACCLQLLPSSSQWLSHALQAFLHGTSTSNNMVHADVDVPASRVSCVCSDSLLRLLSSPDAAETQSEAAVHRPRAHTTAWHVVGFAQATLFVSSTLLLAVLNSACGILGHLGRLDVLNDAYVSVCKCDYRCVLVGYSVSTTRGPVGDHSGALRDMLLHFNAKT